MPEAMSESDRPRILILWSEDDSRNLGVRALAAGTAALVRAVWPDAQLEFQGYGPGDAPIRIGDPKRLVRQLGRPHSELAGWLRPFDLVVDTRAGDSFADIYGLRRLVTMSLMGELVHRVRVPLVLGPQTIGPFATRRGRSIARRTLRTTSVVLARDAVSAEIARSLGGPSPLLTTDVAFALPVNPRTNTRDVILNVSGLLWHPNPHVDFVAYRATIADLCRSLILSGRRVSLLAHVLDSPLADNDVPAVRDLRTLLDDEVEMLVPTGLDDVRELLASAQVVVGSRMHACLNAIAQGVPAVPLAYSRKFEPLLAGLGWEHTVDLRASASPVEGILKALDQPELDTALARVRERADELTASAEKALRRMLE